MKAVESNVLLAAVERAKDKWIHNSVGDVGHVIAHEIRELIANKLIVAHYRIQNLEDPVAALEEFALAIGVPFNHQAQREIA